MEKLFCQQWDQNICKFLLLLESSHKQGKNTCPFFIYGNFNLLERRMECKGMSSILQLLTKKSVMQLEKYWRGDKWVLTRVQGLSS